MKKIIKISDTHYIIVDFDIQFQEGDWVYDFKDKVIRFVKMYLKDEWCKKIIHSTQPLEGVKQILLSEVEEAIYGYDMEKIQREKFLEFRAMMTEINQKNLFEIGVREGFNAHKELVKDKLFTVEDMKMATSLAWIHGQAPEDNLTDSTDVIIELLLPKTEWEVEFDEQGKLKLV